MSKPKTNFAWVLNLLGARPRDLCEAVGADKSLVSRWCNGKQKLMPNHVWIEPVADYLLQLDDKLKSPIIPSILSTYYPGEKQNSKNVRRELLLRWLAQIGHKPTGTAPERTGVLSLIMDKIEKFENTEIDEPQEPEDISSQNAVVYGIKGVQATALQLVEMVINEPEPQELLFVCPEGLDMLTRDKKYHPMLMDGLVEMFAAGHKLSVVIRTDYKPSDIIEICGRWLVAHLMGYINSYYYDDFNNDSKDRMLAVIPGIIAGRASVAGNGEVFASIQFDQETVDEVHKIAQQYKAKSKQRFSYDFFENPDGFLHNIQPLTDKAHYRIVRLPHLGVASIETIQYDFSLNDDEIDILQTEFYPLILEPSFYNEETPVRHVFCENDIEDALLKSRHFCPELTSILDKRVMMKTQDMVNRLICMKNLLQKHKNYEICFLSDSIFKKLTMQIACWGDKAIIGWIAGGASTACKDYLNTNALTGFCELMWNKIPTVAKSRATAMRKINTWLKKAAKYGYTV